MESFKHIYRHIRTLITPLIAIINIQMGKIRGNLKKTSDISGVICHKLMLLLSILGFLGVWNGLKKIETCKITNYPLIAIITVSNWQIKVI